MSFFSDINDRNFLRRWRPLIDEGKYVLSNDGKIYQTAAYTGIHPINPDVPWIYVLNDPNQHCDFLHDLRGTFGFIPTRCLSCWKVVVRPRNIEELMKLYVVQNQMAKEDETCFCKCGIETRPHVFGKYGGYFYTRSQDEGFDRLDRVRFQVYKNISAGVPVFLKRYCTEYERDFGPSDKYQQPPEAKKWEALAEDRCVLLPYDDVQPEQLKMDLIQGWMDAAWDIGDPSIYKLTDGVPLHTPYVKYERETPKE